MKDRIDLHLHTTASDGKKSPAELLELVRQADLGAFAVTDHDTLEGYRAVKGLIREDDPVLIPGIELSAALGDRDAHLLAYYFDPDHGELNERIDRFRQRRDERSREILAKLSDLGLEVPFAAVREAAGEGVIGRPHIAEAMAAVGVVRHYEQAFRKYIHNGGPAYVPKARMTPKEAIDLVHAAGGVVVLAHPFLDNMYKHLEELVGLGLDGLEMIHYTHSKSEISRARAMAREYNLAVTGGSDYHGRDIRNAAVGSVRVPIALLDELKERSNRVRGHA